MAFPIKGAATYAREFNPPKHNGVDIFAERGTPILAPDAGAVTFAIDPLGGNVANLKLADGRRYYFAHLERYEGQSGRIVAAGDVIGYVGNTGNARGTSPHLHFEVHDASGGAVDPYPLLEEVAGPEHKHPVAPGGSPAPPPAPPPPVPTPPTQPVAPPVANGSMPGWLILLAVVYFAKKRGRLW